MSFSYWRLQVDKIKQAVAATDIVMDSIAVKASLQTCAVNGAGILYDPSLTRSDLKEAKAAIQGR